MEKDSDGQHRSEGPAFNDGQRHIDHNEFVVGQDRGPIKVHHIGLDYNIDTTCGAAGGLNYGEKKGGADDQK